MVKIYNGVGGPADRTIDAFGFSRGAAESREFVNRIYRDGIPDISSSHVVTMPSGETTVVYDRYFHPQVRFLGRFDTVASMGMPGDNSNPGFDLSIPPNVQVVRQAVARDERRELFPLSRVVDPLYPDDPRIVEKVFPGVHSDIGGGYGDRLDPRALIWMTQEAKAAGVPIDGKALVQAILRERIGISEEPHNSDSIIEQTIDAASRTQVERKIFSYSNPQPRPKRLGGSPPYPAPMSGTVVEEGVGVKLSETPP